MATTRNTGRPCHPSRTGANSENGSRAIRVLIVSEVRVHRESLEILLSEDAAIVVVGSAETPDDAFLAASECEIVLFDAAASNGFQGVREIVRKCPDAPVLALGVSDSGSDVLELAEAGVVGYVPAGATTKQLIRALRGVASGESPCPPAMIRSLLTALGKRSIDGPSSDDRDDDSRAHLTHREIEVLRLIARGLSNKEIAQRLYIEVATVKNHVHSLLQKLNLNRRAEAASWLSGRGFERIGLTSQDSLDRDLDQKI